MKFFFKSILFFVIISLTNSCGSSKNSMEKMKADIYNNNFSFVAINYENRTSYSAPAGTGRIISTNTPSQTEGVVGIIVSHDKLIMNLPSTDQETSINKYSLQTTSENFTVARKNLDNGNILLNFFLKDKKDINLIKMEIDKKGKTDCSVEGPKQKAVFYTGYIQ